MTRTRLRTVGAGVLLVCLSLVPHAGTLQYGYVNIDDPYTIVDYPLLRDLSWSTLPRFFTLAERPRVTEYMPLKDVSYGIDMALIGTDGPSLRPQQLLWYALCVLLFWLWLRGVVRRGELAWLAALLFGLHPVHVESVTWLSGRKDLLSAAFMLGAMIAAWAGQAKNGPAPPAKKAGSFVAVLVFQLLALLSKPMAVMTPALIVLQDLCGTPRVAWRTMLRTRAPLYAALVSMVAAYVTVYVKLVGSVSTSLVDSEAYRVFDGPAFIRWGQQLGAFMWLTVQPAALAPTLPPLLDPSVLSVKAVAGAVLLVSYIALLLVLLWKSPHWALALGLFAIPLTPILLFPPWAQYVAGRYLFLSVGGVCIAIALAVAAAERASGMDWLRYPLFGIIALAWAGSTLVYNDSWENSLTLWSRVSERYPDFAHSHRLAGGGAMELGDEDAARYWFTRCVEVRAEDVECASLLARFIAVRNPAGARRLLRGILSNDDDGHAHRELARLLMREGRSREALALYEGWLAGRAVTPELVAPVVDLALAAGEPERAFHHARQLLNAQTAQFPAFAPPTETFLRVAEALGDPELRRRVQEAAQGCARSDCFKSAMGW